MRIRGWSCPSAVLATALAILLPVGATAQTPPRPYCGPIDVVFVIDDTTTMESAVFSLKQQVAAIVQKIEESSLAAETAGFVNPDYRIGFVTFKDNVIVKLSFAYGNGAAFASLVNDPAWKGEFGGNWGDASDEALNTVIQALPANARPPNIPPFQIGDFSVPFRPGVVNGNVNVRRIIILVTDTAPSGFRDDYLGALDDANAHQRAVEAAAKQIKIAGFFTANPGSHPEGIGIMEDYALVTGGFFMRTDEPVIIPVGDAILNYLSSCTPVNKPPVARCTPASVTPDPLNGCRAAASLHHPDNPSFDPEDDVLGLPVALNQWPQGPFAVGSTLVTLTATDSAGATHTCRDTVTVVETAECAAVPDSEPPWIALATPPAPVHGTPMLTAAATDNGGIQQVEFFAGAVSIGLALEEPYTALWDTTGLGGGTVVTLRAVATDTSGNIAESAVTVTIAADTTAPVVTISVQAAVEATSAAGAVVGFSATATDNLDGLLTPSCNRVSGSTFPIGATTITCTATDSALNVGTASSTVTVADTTPPSLTIPASFSVPAADATGAIVNYVASAADLVDGVVPADCDHPSGSLFPVGPTSVMCVASDLAGNISPAQFFTVTVVADTTAPVVTVPAPITAEAMGPTGAIVTFTASALDNVDGARPTTCTPASGSTFALGPTTVTCSATDTQNNTGSATFVITVADTTAPTLAVPANRNLEITSGNSAVAIFAATATDLVDGAIVPVCAPASGSTFTLGTTTVTCTATDTRTNSRSGTFTVTVTLVVRLLTSVTFTADVTAPQTPGTGITFTAAAAGGTAPNQFKWWLYDGTTWTMAKTWSSETTFTWTPATPNAYYLVCVWARSADNAADGPAKMACLSFPILSSYVTGVTLTADVGAPQPPGTKITFTAAATGGTPTTHRFKWWLYDGVTWTIAKDWSAETTFAWTPATANAHYLVYVWARSGGNTADAPEKMAGRSFPILSSFVTGVTLTANKTAPQPAGTPVTFTAAATGGTAPYQFKFWLYDGTAWTIGQTWSESPTFVWTPATANVNYLVYVWARSAGNTADVSERMAGRSFPIVSTP